MKTRTSTSALLAAGVMTAMAASAHAQVQGQEQAPRAMQAPTGYLTASDRAHMVDGVPPPPAPGSEVDLADKATSARYRAFEDSDRWLLATSHAELRPQLAIQHFDCALGVRFGSSETPNLNKLMVQVFYDAESVAEQVKRRAARPRPVGDDPQRRACQTINEAGRKSASYPSGSAAVGAAYGEAFAAIDPEHAEAARAIGHELGVSRLVCGMHYPSDVATGEAIGRATVTQALATSAFQADLAAARVELAAVRAKGLTNPGCAAERAVLPTVLP